jgi:hypothetical protein
MKHKSLSIISYLKDVECNFKFLNFQVFLSHKNDTGKCY